MTVTVPGRRQEIAKRTGRIMQPPQVFNARLLAGHVDAIWTNFEHGTKEYFDRECLSYAARQEGLQLPARRRWRSALQSVLNVFQSTIIGPL